MKRPALLVAVAALLLSTVFVRADQTADELAALRKLIESQNQKIEQLTEKVRQLERSQPVNSTNQLLPTIVIDPDGVPVSVIPQGQEQLQEKIRALEQRQEASEAAAIERARKAPFVSIGAEGFSFGSADTNFVLKIRGIFQVDSRRFFGDNDLNQGNDGFLLRRVRPVFEGTVYRDFDFVLMPDFSGANAQVFDAYLNYRYRPELQLRVGKVRGPVGLENMFADSMLAFNERSYVTGLVPSRSVGVQLWGEFNEGVVSYAAGFFNGDGDGRLSSNTDFSDDKVIAARLFTQPFKHSSLTALKGLGFGVGGSYSQVTSNSAALPSTTGGTVPGYFTPAQQQFFAYNPLIGPVVADGVHWRISPQGYYLYGPFGLLGEYAISHQGVLNSATFRRAELEHNAWQLSAQWVLTGEPASFTGITPKNPFDPLAGGWGAWQLVARFSQLDIDDAAFQGFSNPVTSASAATTWSVGINWWLNRNVRVLTSYSRTVFDGGGGVNLIDPATTAPPATVAQQPENVFFTRIQLAF